MIHIIALLLCLSGLPIPTTNPAEYGQLTVVEHGSTTAIQVHQLVANRSDVYLYVRGQAAVVPLYGWSLRYLSPAGDMLIVQRDHRPTDDQADPRYWQVQHEYRIEFVAELLADFAARQAAHARRMRLDFDADGRPGTQSDFGLLQIRLGTPASQPADAVDLRPDGQVDELDVKAFEQLRKE